MIISWTFLHTFETNKCGQKCFCVLLYKKYSGGKKIMEKTYNVSEAASVIGVSVKTLQRWDREGKLVANRTPSNRRFYTENQLKELEGDNVMDGFKKIAKKFVEYLKADAVFHPVRTLVRNPLCHLLLYIHEV